MKTQPIKDIQFKNLGNDPANYSTPPDDISIPSVMLLVAKPRSGKTRMVSNLFHRLKQAGSIDRILICSSTFHSNKKMMEELGIDEETDVFDPEDEPIPKIIALVEHERDLLEEYREQLEIFKQLKQLYKTPLNLEEHELYLFREFIDFRSMKWLAPFHKYGGRKPSLSVFFDDIQSSSVIGCKAFKNLIIKFRHIGAFKSGETAIGLNIAIAVQNYVASGNEGIPKSVRGVADKFVIWRSGNKKELDLLTTELSGQLPKEKIMRAYDYVMGDESSPDSKYNFLFVDLAPKKNHLSQLRKNYNEYILDD